MICSVVACGPSASEWFNTPCDISVGVNDCLKFGKDTDYLLCVNAPKMFEPKKKNEYKNRLEIIKQSSARFVTSLCPEWKKYKPQLECIGIQRYGKHFRKGSLFFTRSSSFIAIQYAHSLGATDIILWGVDFINHPNFPAERATEFEIEQYIKLFEFLKGEGVNVWIGNKETVFKDYLKVWQS